MFYGDGILSVVPSGNNYGFYPKDSLEISPEDPSDICPNATSEIPSGVSQMLSSEVYSGTLLKFGSELLPDIFS